jgi:hypothetical protein
MKIMGFYLASSEAIRNARKAFDAGELQINKDPQLGNEGHYCLYTGPCAIGVSLPSALRAQLDTLNGPVEQMGGVGIVAAIDLGLIETDNRNQLEWLQFIHDTGDLESFNANLQVMEEECTISEQPSPSA